MATFYGRTGNWSAAGTWSNTSGGASNGLVPDATTDCILDANTTAITIDGTSGSPNLCRSLDCTGYTNTLTHASAKQLNVGDGTTGNVKFVSGMTYSPNSASVLKLVSTTTGNTFTTGTKSIGGLVIDGAGGAWTLQDAYTAVSSSSFTLTNGTWNTNNNNMSSASSNTLTFSITGTGTRTLTLGTSTISLGSNSSWDATDTTNLTFSGASSTITFTATSQNPTFIGGGLTYGTLTHTALTTGSNTISGANTFSAVTLSCGASTLAVFNFGGNQTCTGTWTGNGNSVINRVYYRSTVRGTARTISAGTWTFTNIDLQDMTAAGAGNADISAITGGSGNCGGNTGWTFTTPVNRYWVPSGGTSTGSESATTRWSASSGGAGGATSPLPQDTAYFDANSIDAGSRTITQDKPRIGAHIWTGATNTPTWARSTNHSFFGNITLIAGMTLSGTSSMTYEGRSSSTYTTAGLTQAGQLIIDCVNSVGTLTQGDNFVSSSALTGTSGSFSGASTYTTQFQTCSWAGGTFTETGTMTLSSTFAVSGGTFGNGVGLITGCTTVSPSGGTTNVKGFSLSGAYNQTAGTVTIGSSGITGGTTFTVQTGVCTLTINAASSCSGNILLSGAAGSVINLNANLASSGGTVSVAGGVNTINIASSTLSGTNTSVVGSGAAATTKAYTFV